MYLLLDGEVSLVVGGKSVDTVKKGEIFGEMAALSRMPRSATAVAKTPCRVISLDEKQFQSALQDTPQFALMLMSIIISRLRLAIARLSVGSGLAGEERWNECRVFDRKLLDELVAELGNHPPVYQPLNKVILNEGEAGAFMYVVLEGTVAILMQGKVVEKVGPGGVFGEMALVDKSPRAAGAKAETDCSLLAINRNDFLELAGAKPAFGLSLLKAAAERLRYMNSRLDGGDS
ncbi:MAG: cyclic nucleotide-binding domain-containing protein [Burkholderiales bacterium]|nr:cyclic nucleotide-binding domain-containing protein [Burkholderiales bacterium]